MSFIDRLKTKIGDILSNSDEETLRRDSLQPEDPDFLLNSPSVIGYNNLREQFVGFQHLITGFNPLTDSLLDVGCGRGDLYGFISELHKVPKFNYIGIDHDPKMLNLAKEKYNIDIYNLPFDATTEKADWVVACGIFTPRRCNTETEDLEKLFDDVDKMYNLCNKVVSFNLLTPINTTIQEGFFYVHPGLVMDMLIEKYHYVTVKHNYSNETYTVTINKF
jgi:SAM-dependent methyltransferase